MARINTNIPSMIARTNLARATDDLALRLQRLSTGLRINRGADDPAGLIVSERLRSELQGLGQAIDNSERASSVISTAEGHLAEVADLLNSMLGLAVEAANSGGVSREEVEANQLQIDSAIDSITRISNTASFAGLQLLNGSLAYITSGVPTSAIDGIDVRGAQFGLNPAIAVQVEVINSAETAELYLSGTGTGSLTSSVTIEIAGNTGVQTLSFVSATPLSAVVSAVNTVKDATGISAALVSAGDMTCGMTFNSVKYGSSEFVSVKRIGEGGDFFATYESLGGTQTQRDEGLDVGAVINGALAIGDGLDITLNTPALNIEMSLTADYAQTLASMKTFTITGGGASFQLGPSITATQQVGLGIRSVAASRLGGTTIGGVRYHLDTVKSGGVNSILDGDPRPALVLESAITEVSLLRGRLGAFERNTLQTNIRALEIGFENIAASESRIRDTDFAEETAALTRAQILNQAGTSVLATANVISQNVLSLLG